MNPKLPRATLLRFDPEAAGRETLDALFMSAQNLSLDPEEKIGVAKAVGLTSPRFEGDREITPHTCRIEAGFLRFRVTTAARKVSASALRAEVGRRALAIEKEHHGVPPCRRDVARIKYEVRAELARKAPVVYSHIDLFVDLRSGTGITDAAPGSAGMEKVREFLGKIIRTDVQPVNPTLLCPKEYGDEPCEPFHPGGQSEAFSRPHNAGLEFLTWIVVRGSDGPVQFGEITISPETPCLLVLEPVRCKLEGFHGLYGTELREALLSGKTVRSVGIRATDAEGEEWSAILDSELSLSSLSLPPVDADRNEKRHRLEVMTKAVAALSIVRGAFQGWLRDIRMDRKKWATFTAACRTVHIEHIGHAKEVERIKAKIARSDADNKTVIDNLL